MKDKVLVLGAGNRKLQAVVAGFSEAELQGKGPTFEDNFKEVTRVDIDPACKPNILWDLTHYPWPLKDEEYDEVHAYELLEHLVDAGDYEGYFRLWREIWRVTKPGGLVCATTPWWQSFWVWGDPGHRMCYNRGILMYLDQEQYEKQIGFTAMTDYRRYWPKPYCFRAIKDQMTGADPLSAGYMFILWKPTTQPGSP